MEEQTWQQLTQGIKLTSRVAQVDDQLLFLVTSSQGQDTYSQALNVVDSGVFEQVPLTKKEAVSTDSAPKQFTVQDYSVGPQTYTGKLLGYISSDDRGGEIVVRGGDPLGRLRWQAGITGGNLQRGYAFLAKSNWYDINWFAEYVNNSFESPAFTQNLAQVNVEVAKRLHLNNDTNLQIAVGAGNAKIDDFSIDNWKLKTGVNHRDYWGSVSYGIFAGAQLTDYQGESESWQGKDFSVGLNIGHGRTRIGYRYNDYRLDPNAPDHAMLRFGGIKATNSSQVSSQLKLNNRLPLAWQQGHQFTQHVAELTRGDLKLFYLAHQTDDNDPQQAYGIELAKTKARSTSPLLEGSSISAGITWFETENAISATDTSHQYYLSIGYQFR